MMLTAPTTGDSDEAYGGLDKFNSVKVVDHSQRDIYQSRRSRSCIVDNWKLHDSIHHLKFPSVKKKLFHQFTFSLVPEVRTFGSGSTEAGSGSTEAVMSEKGNNGKFDAVTFDVEQRISIDEDDPLIKL